MAAKGTSLVYVVTSAKMPAVFTPRRLISTTNQMAPSVRINATGLLNRCSGARFMTAPAKANAIAGSDAQMEIQ